MQQIYSIKENNTVASYRYRLRIYIGIHFVWTLYQTYINLYY
jgi:hypothetical protein